jgi:hypothetical protein
LGRSFPLAANYLRNARLSGRCGEAATPAAAPERGRHDSTRGSWAPRRGRDDKSSRGPGFALPCQLGSEFCIPDEQLRDRRLAIAGRTCAEECGVNARTLYRWMQDHDFGEAYRRARR